MRVLICGSRGWSDPRAINMALAGLGVLADGASEPLVIIHGAAPGADALAGRLAKQWGAEVVPYPANWFDFGKAAGPIRNQQMLDEGKPDMVLAFRSTGKSNGTDDMINRSKNAGLPVFIITTPEET